MNRDVRLILRGFFLACLGFLAMSLYILGLSNLFVGKSRTGLVCLGAAVLAMIVLARGLRTYLTDLESDRH
jgi:hypothetical protein